MTSQMRPSPAPYAALFACAAACFLAVSASAQRSPAPLETAAAIRQQRAAPFPSQTQARVRGVVTFLFPAPGLAYVQDETGGVCVIGNRDRRIRADLRVGSQVEVSGVLAPGESGPLVNSAHRQLGKVTILGNAPLPAAKSLTIAELAQPANQGIIVQVAGIVRAVRRERGLNAAVLTMAAGRERVDAIFFQARASKLPTGLIGAQVRMSGVYNTAYAGRQQVFAKRLLVAAYKYIVVDTPAAAPWDLPVTSLARGADDQETLATAPPGTRVRIQGAVTLPLPGRGMYLQSTEGAVAVESSQEEPIVAGDTLEAVGFVSRRDGSPVIEDAVWRSAPAAHIPEPRTITAEQALSGEHDAQLVRMEGLLLESSQLDEGPTLVLQSGTRVFLARYVAPDSARSLNENSWLRITGICLNGQMPELRVTPGGEARRTFHLLLSGPEAVQVARAPSWWTLRRMLAAFGGLLGLAAAALAWVIVLRRRVTRQTGKIREHVARETLYEERVRIARELHDSLEQDLVGIGMQLKATERLLIEPDRARSALHLASAMVRRSQVETHRAVWDLREPITEGRGFAEALHTTLAVLAPEDGPEVKISVSGDERPLAPQTESHLLRIAAEAVTNARKHAHATSVQVAASFGAEEVRLSVSDDGSGFDIESLPPPAAGHFGLFGMRERVEKLGGKLELRSALGGGTQIDVTAPIASPAASLT